MEKFSNRLKEAMQIRKVKQVDLVDKTGIAKSTLNNYLAGRYEAKQDRIYILAVSLEVSPVWLMGYDVPMELEEEIREQEKNRLQVSIEQKKEETDKPILQRVIIDDLQDLSDEQLYQIINLIKTFK